MASVAVAEVTPERRFCLVAVLTGGRVRKQLTRQHPPAHTETAAQWNSKAPLKRGHLHFSK